MKPPRPVALTLRLYRALARAYPCEFKNAYGDEMVQVAEDAIEPVWRHHGVAGLVRLLADIALRLPVEHFSELWQDLRYGARTLAAAPAFTAIALLSLGLGISLASSVFSEVNALLLRDVPGVSQPDELVAWRASYPQYRRYRERTDMFSATLAAVAPVPFGVSLGGHTERIWGHLVTPSYFPTLGVRPMLGRFFGAEHEKQGSAPAVVVSERFWRNQLGSDPAVVGKVMSINAHPCTVIGVAPAEFLGHAPMLTPADLWMPATVNGNVAPELADNALERRSLAMFSVVARLRPGVSFERAEAGVDATLRQFNRDAGEVENEKKGRLVWLAPGGKLNPIRKEQWPAIAGFFTAFGGLILLIACANVGNMMIARGADRRKEIAVRLALGASRARLVRQLLTESMIVAAGAGILGFLLTVWLMHMASQLKLPHAMPTTFYVEADAHVLLFTVGLTVFAGLAFGLVPALQATRTDLTPALKEGGAVRLRRHRWLSLRNVLVVSQMSASLALLLLTGFMVLSFQRNIVINAGFDPRNLFLISLDPVRDGYSREKAAALFPKLLDRMKRLPSVRAASLTETVPMSASGWVSTTVFSEQGAKQVLGAKKCVVGKDYFDATGIPILRGRGFRQDDESDRSTAVIVSERFARDIAADGDPLGRRIETGEGAIASSYLFVGSSFDYRDGVHGKGREMFVVVGVARDAKESITDPPFPTIYFPLRTSDLGRASFQGITLMMRAAPGVDVLRDVRREIATIDPKLMPFRGRTMMEQIELLQVPVRIGVWTYTLVGFFGLILASVGLAGVTAYSVTRRYREIGIRIALGAASRDVLTLVMREGALLVMVGTAIGLAFASAGMRLLGSALEPIGRNSNTSMSDPVLLVGATALLATLALTACYVPARRSTRVDPVVALRQE